MEGDKKVVAVTGANGFVGSHLVDFLIKSGYHVKSIVRETSDLKWLEGKATELCKCGLMDIPALQKAFADVVHIYHIAGTTKTNTEDGFMHGNVGLTKNVLEAALVAPKLEQIVISSSLAAVGPCREGQIIDESKACQPMDPYGRSKVAQEKLAKEYMDRLPISILRPPPVYGARDVEVYKYFQAINGRICPKIGLWGKKRLSMVHIDNLVEASYLVANTPKASGQTYFVTDPEDFDWDQIGEMSKKILGKWALPIRVPHFMVFVLAAVSQSFAKLTGRTVMLNVDKARQMVAPCWVCSAEKLRKDTGYVGKVGIEEAFEKTIRWYQKEKWLK